MRLPPFRFFLICLHCAHARRWITRKYQQGLFICAAKGFVQLKIEKADPSTVRKSGLKKHVWFQAWGCVKDDKIEIYSDYPPKARAAHWPCAATDG